jgi:membrane fusion protein, multidrug efflux system
MKRAVLWLSGTVIVSLTLVGAYRWWPNERSGAANPVVQRPLPVTAALVEARDFPVYRIGLGTVQAFNTVTIKVRVDGEIQKIAFYEGQDVRVGDLLAQIDPRPYEALLRQAEADKARDEALLGNAKLDLDRYSTLVARDFATRQSVDTQKALVAQYQAAIKRDQATIDNANVQLGYTTIKSPLNGRTGVRLIDQGNIVHANDAGGLVVITQLDPIALIFTLPQQYLAEVADAIRRGPPVVLAYDQDNRIRLAEGHLQLIDNLIDQGTGSVRLKAIFPNAEHRLWPGAFVNVWLQLEVRHGPVVKESVTMLLWLDRMPVSRFVHCALPQLTTAPRSLPKGSMSATVWLWMDSTGYVQAPGSSCQIPSARLRRRQRVQSLERPNEHIGALHHPACCDRFADGRARHRRLRCLYVASGSASAPGRLPNHRGHCAVSRNQPRDHGVVRRVAS